MAWKYIVADQQVLRPDGSHFGPAYSGTGEGRNNSAMENVPDVGPTPRGRYKIGPAYNDPKLGPIVMHLDPLPGTNDFGRSLFRIHGNNAENDASHGCIILAHEFRIAVSRSADKEIDVV